MKKIISVLLVIVLLSAMCITSYANESANNIFIINNKTIIFDEDSSFTIEEKQFIAELLANPDQEHTTYGLVCTLLGHKNTTETVHTITHCVDTQSPRCLQENFLITTCSRCGESTVERISYFYITCCPED